MTDFNRFMDQNPLLMETITDEQLERIQEEGLIEHHSGGLFVLGMPVGSRYAKCHDSWGDEGTVVVHIYNPEKPDDPLERVIHFTTGRAAVDYFLSLDEPEGLTPEETQRHQYQAAVDAFKDIAQYPAVRVVEDNGMVWMECANGHHWGSAKPEDGCRTCRTAHNFRAAGRPDCIVEDCHEVVTCSERAWNAGIRKCARHHELQLISQVHSGPICLDELVTVMGQYSDRRWNGWICPHIDAWSVQHTLEQFSPDDDLQETFTWEWDDELDRPYLQSHSRDYPGECDERLDPDEDGLYPLGYMSWTWSEDTQICGVLINELPCVRNKWHVEDDPENHDTLRSSY